MKSAHLYGYMTTAVAEARAWSLMIGGDVAMEVSYGPGPEPK
jgi:hypothetical protein